MKTCNKKIRNATVCKDGGITFKSQLEKMAYNTLTELGFKPLYEPRRITLVEGFIPTVPFYNKETDKQQQNRIEEGSDIKHKLLKEQYTRVLPITYTPDIYFNYKGVDIWIELKGIENDCYYLKKKLFRLYLEKQKELGCKSMFFEVYSKKQLFQVVDIIKSKQWKEKV